MKWPHWLACRWSKWEPYKRDVQVKGYWSQEGGWTTITATEPQVITEYREKRRCETCGTTQDRLVRGA